ncbi:MAG: ATP-grasp domain-containing protein [Candidatus Gastranaerophilales bacterium]|nr:ATP-grasp domain-containing protein [Candidatus Gastranaerophilales bacterium]
MKRILIVGSDANCYSLAKNFNKKNKDDIIFVAPGNPNIKDFATNVEISSTDGDGLVEFAKANEVHLTVVVDPDSIAAGVADAFSQNELNVFAPNSDSARVALNKSSAKKILYKMRVQTPKFGIFDRENAAVDYVRRANYPMIIKNDIHVDGGSATVCHTFSQAKLCIEKFFEEFNKKLVIEDFVEAKTATLYFVTDGYSALPIGSCCSKEYFKDGYKTPFYNLKSISAPDYFISKEIESKIKSRVLHPMLDEIAKIAKPYVGIIGVDVLLQKNIFQVLKFVPFFKKGDFQAILPQINENLYEVFLAAVVGSLSDDYNYINFNDNVAFSMILIDKNIQEDDEVDIAYSNSNRAVVTSEATTVTCAKNRLKEYIESVYSPDEISIDAFIVNERDLLRV